MRQSNLAVLGVLPLLLACGGNNDDSHASTETTSGGAGDSSSSTTSTGGSSSSSGGSDQGAGGSDQGTNGSGGSSGGTPASGGGPTSGGETSTGAGGGAGSDAGSDTWEDVTNNLISLASGGRDISVLTVQPDTGRVIVGVGERGLFATDDAGETWFALGQGSGSDAIPNRPAGLIFDPEDAAIFWENGIYGGAGVFVTTDNGDTFTRLGDISHNDGLGVDFSDPERRTLLAGTHEKTQQLYLSIDAGQNWTDVGAALPDGSGFSSYPYVIDSETFLLGVCGGSGACGVYRSVDQAESWTLVTEYPPGSPPMAASDGSIYWPLTGTSGIMVSHDDGETWSQADGPVRSRTGTAVELPDGRVVALGQSYLQISADQGASWEPVGAELPYPAQNCNLYGVTYSPSQKAFFVDSNDCSGMVEYSAIFRLQFDYETQ